MSRQHWNTFWEQGYITTFGESLAENYSGRIRKLWESIFSTVRKGDRILDIATGNGAVACIAAEVAAKNNTGVEIFAADAAKIAADIEAPDHILEVRKDINFSSWMACEKLDFPDNHFDYVTSQYGIEYSELGSSIPEVYRVLKPSGCAHFISHRDQTRIVKDAAKETSIYDSAINEYRIFDVAEAFTNSYGNSGSTQSEKSAALNQAMNRFLGHYRREELCQILVSDIAAHLRRLKTMSVPEVKAQLSTRKTEYQAAFARLQDMAQAALDDAGLEHILGLSSKVGFASVNATDIYQNQDLIGVHIHLTK